MKIAYNPTTAAALTTAPNNNDKQDSNPNMVQTPFLISEYHHYLQNLQFSVQ